MPNCSSSNYIVDVIEVNEGLSVEDQNGGELKAGSQERSIAYKLRLAQIMAYQAFEEQVKGFGAAPRYLGLLCVIRANPGQTQTKLAEAIALQRSSLVTILDRLEADGLLERRSSETDRRAKSVWLTPEGEMVVRTLVEQADQHEQVLCETLSAEQRNEVLNGLETIIANLRRKIGRSSEAGEP